MEHRWGERINLDLPVRITAHPFTVRSGRLCNLSVSGAYVRTDVELRLLSRIQIMLDLPLLKCEALPIPAYIARKCKDGFGLEWCEFSPQAASELLQSLSARRHSHLRKPDVPAAIAVTRLSAPLLKHAD